MARNHLTKLNKNTIDRGGFVSVTTAAKHLDCSTSKIYGMINMKKIRAKKIDGMIRIIAEDFLNYIDVHAVAI